MPKFRDRTGETRTMNNGLSATVIAYRSADDLDVEFENGAIAQRKQYVSFARGSIRCPLIVETVDGYARVTNANVPVPVVWLMDTEDLPLLENYLWCANSDGYIWRTASPKHMILHRLIINAPDDMQVDHINRDKRDNRKCNLRLCTNGENQCNTNKRPNNTSGWRGVMWDKKNKKWMAQIGLDNKCIYLGSFDDKIDAARTYNEAALKYHGEFARLNDL